MGQSHYVLLVMSLMLALVSVAVSGFTPALYRRPGPNRVGSTVTALHQAKTVTCYTTQGEKIKALLGDEHEFVELFEHFDVSFVVDETGRRIYSNEFASLDDMANYFISQKDPAYDPNMGSRHGTTRWSRLVPLFRRARRRISKRRFDYSTLPLPHQVRPIIPDYVQSMTYICPDDLRESLLNMVYEPMEKDDSGWRVPPVADPVAVLSVTFNDDSMSPITGEDQKDPVQAFCLRIAFAATRSADECSFSDLKAAYQLFREHNYYLDPKRIVDWLAGSRAILLVDELNILLKCLSFKSPRAYEMNPLHPVSFRIQFGPLYYFHSA